jgi:polycystin 2L1
MENNNNLIPVVSLLTAIKRNKRNKFYYQLFFYLFFLSIYCGINFSLRNIHHSFEQNDAIQDNLLKEEFGFKLSNSGNFEGPQFYKTYYDVMSHEEFWEWIEGPFVGAVYSDKWYNNDELETKNQIMQYNKILGGIQLRQARVKNDICHIDKLDNYQGVCYSKFNQLTEDKHNIIKNGKKYAYSEGWSELYGKSGYGGNYGTGGYSVIIPLNKTAGLDLIANLKKNRWTDKSTRAVVVNMNLFNRNTKLLSVVRILFEFSFTGRIELMTKFFTMPIEPYESILEKVRFSFEILFAIILIYYIWIEIKEIRISNSFLTYASDLWNLLECVNLGLYIGVIGSYLYWYNNELIKNTYSKVINNDTYVDMFDIANLYQKIAILAAINCWFGFLKVFKFLQLSHRMTLLWDTLKYAFWDLMYMNIVFALIIAGFATMTHLVYGSNIKGFHNILSSCSTLLRTLIGEFNYTELINVNSYFTPVFFMLYMFIVFFVIINMFIAVVSEYYERVKENDRIETSLERDSLVLSFSEKITMMSQKYSKKYCKKGCFSERNKNLESIQSIANIELKNITDFSKQWNKKLGKKFSVFSNKKLNKKAQRNMVIDEKMRVKHKIDNLINKAEYRLNLGSDEMPKTNLYNQFLKVWNSLSDKQKEGTLTQQDISLVFNSDEDAIDFVKLYKEYWLQNNKLIELENNDDMKIILPKILEELEDIKKMLQKDDVII